MLVAGNFSYVGRHTGGIANLSLTDASPSDQFPRLNGSISALVSDGQGGYYIAGNYSHEDESVNSNKVRIEHILSDGSFEVGFDLEVIANRINQLLIHNGSLFVCGDNLQRLAGSVVNPVAVMNLSTRVISTDIPSITGNVKKMLISNGKLYFVGEFTSVAGQSRRYAACLELSGFSLSDWNPGANFSPTYLTNFKDIVAYSNSIIMCGVFSDSVSNSLIGTGLNTAIFSNTTGQLENYVFRTGGLFGNVPNSLYFAAGVNVITVDQDILYAFSTGTFDTRITAVFLQPQQQFQYKWMKYFNMTATGTSLKVYLNKLYVTGNSITTVYTRDSTNGTNSIEASIMGALRIDINTGQTDNWRPQPSKNWNGNSVSALDVSGNLLAIGGDFTHVNSISCSNSYLYRISQDVVLPIQFDLPSSGPFSSTVYDACLLGDTLLFAGNFDFLNNQDISILASNFNSGAPLSINFPLKGTARTLSCPTGMVIAGGDFVVSGDLNRRNIAAFNRGNMELLSWQPNPNNAVYKVLSANGFVYVGGDFTNISGLSKPRLARYSENDLSLVEDNLTINGEVFSLYADTFSLWVGGSFSSINGRISGKLANVNPFSFADRPINQQSGPSGNWIADLMIAGKYLFAGGNFSQSSNFSCQNITLFDRIIGQFVQPGSFCVQFEGFRKSILSLERVGNDIIIGGEYLKVNGSMRSVNISRLRFPVGFFDGNGTYISVRNGRWHDPSTWEKSSVPPADAHVIVRHIVQLDQPATCYSLIVEKLNAQLVCQQGFELKINGVY